MAESERDRYVGILDYRERETGGKGMDGKSGRCIRCIRWNRERRGVVGTVKREEGGGREREGGEGGEHKW